MDYQKYLDLDVNKLHSESLQLRNQQFQIVTIALASTGISAWIVPAITSNMSTDNPFNETVIVTATIVWIILLGVLFFWSLSLKRLIDIISIYLKKKEVSEWEENFRQFDKESKLYKSQTGYSFFVFLCYGWIVSASGYIATKGILCQLIVIGTCIIYTIICSVKYLKRSKSSDIDEEWSRILKV